MNGFRFLFISACVVGIVFCEWDYYIHPSSTDGGWRTHGTQRSAVLENNNRRNRVKHCYLWGVISAIDVVVIVELQFSGLVSAAAKNRERKKDRLMIINLYSDFT